MSGHVAVRPLRGLSISDKVINSPSCCISFFLHLDFFDRYTNTMVDKRSLRSSKKDSQDAGAEEEKSKQPTRQRSTRSRKTKTQPETPLNESPAPTGNPSEEIGVQVQHVVPNDDVEMKTAEEETKEDKADEAEPVEDPKAAVIASLFHVWT